MLEKPQKYYRPTTFKSNMIKMIFPKWCSFKIYQNGNIAYVRTGPDDNFSFLTMKVNLNLGIVLHLQTLS